MRRYAPLDVNLDPLELLRVDVAELASLENLFARRARLRLRALRRVTPALLILLEHGGVALHLLDLSGLAAIG